MAERCFPGRKNVPAHHRGIRRHVLSVTTGVALATAVWGLPLAAQEADRCRASTMHPGAPPEASQFGFLIGRWNAEVTEPSEDGSWGAPRHAYWEAEYILDGFAVADYWYDHTPTTHPDTQRGVNVRMFNQATGVWDITWQHTEDPPLLLTGRMDGESMVLDGESPDGGLIRIVFHNLEQDSWDWYMDVSGDQGATWTRAMRIRAERLGC